MNWRDIPRFTFIPAFTFAEDTVFNQQDFVAGLVVSADSSMVFPVCVIVCLFLSLFPYFCPVSKERDIKKHAPTKNGWTWWGFQYWAIGRANGPCSICEKVCYVTLSDCFNHIYFTCAEHRHDRLMHMLEYCACLRILDTGWLTLQTICFTEGLEVKFKFTSVVVDNVLATRVSTKPGPVY